MGMLSNQYVVFVDKFSNDSIDVATREIADKYCCFKPEKDGVIYYIFSHKVWFDKFNAELIEHTEFGYH